MSNCTGNHETLLTIMHRSSVQLVEPVIKHLFLHPSAPSDFISLATQLHSDLTALASANAEGACHLLDLQVRLLPLHPTSSCSELLWVQSVITHLLLLHSSLTPDSRESMLHNYIEMTGARVSFIYVKAST